MQIYTGLVIYIFILAYFMFVNREDSFGKRKIFIIMSLLPMIIIMGFRGLYVGTDTRAYGVYFRQVSEISWLDCVLSRGTALKNAPCYLLWSKVVMTFLGGSYQFFLFLNAIIICSSIAYFIYKNSNHVVLSICLYILGYYYLNSFNASRQYMSFAFMLVAYTCMKENKGEKAFLFAVLGVGIHIVSICFLPVIFLVWNKISKKAVKKVYGFCVLAAGVIGVLWLYQYIFEVYILSNWWEKIARLFTGIFPKYNAYLLDTEVGIHATGEGKKIYLGIFYLAFVVFALYVVYINKTIDEIQKELLLELLIPSSIGVVIGIVAADLTLISRIEVYFSIFVICLIPELLFLIEQRYRYLAVVLTLGIMCVPFYMQLNSNISGVVPYDWFLNKEKF